MKLGPDTYQLNTFNITKWAGGGRGRNQRTTRKCLEIKRNLTLTSKTSLENAKEIFIAIHNHLTLAFM